jgi:predicted dehydrogenase
MQKLRAAVIGVGYLGRFHAQKYAASEDCELVAVIDARPDVAAKVAAETGAEALNDYLQVAGRIDVASVATTTPSHFDIAAWLLRAGVHVLVEKPITSTVEQAGVLIEIAAAQGRVLQVGHLERFNPAIVAAEPLLGTPRFIECHRLAPFRMRGTDVNVVLDLMIHDIDLVHTLVGGHATSVLAAGVPVLTPFVDIANARLAFDSGAVANITASRVSRERMRKLRIFQQSGYLSLDLNSGTGEFYRLRHDLDMAALATAPLALEQFVERIALEAEEGDALTLEFQSFLAAVRGEAPIPVTGEAGREALAVALQIVADIERALPMPPSGSRA